MAPERWESRCHAAAAQVDELVTQSIGQPVWREAPAWPGLQLGATTTPFYVNFGDTDVGYLLASTTWRAGRFLWQCG